MSIVIPSERGEWWASPDRDQCFYCDEPVQRSTTAVQWMGTDDLLLHPACARQLGTHLICDSREAELASLRGPWARRAARALRAAVLEAEGVRQ